MNDTASADTVNLDFVRSLPKAEVHVHLEGCFTYPDIAELARAAGVPIGDLAKSVYGVAGGESQVDSVGSFLDFLDWECSLVTTAEQAARAAYRAAAQQTASGVRYTDLIVNPTHWAAWKGRVPDLFAAFAAGLAEADEDGLCRINLCPSLKRQQSASEAAELLDWMVTDRPERVVALSIDGDEHLAGRTGTRFAEAYRRAADAGFRRTVHAGESSGPEGVWDAIDLLGAERIDHGVRAIEDPDLVKELAERDIPLTNCPTSNVTLGLYPDLASHPIRAFHEAGIRASINTDDPATIGTRLESEWMACADAFDWTRADLVRIAGYSITSAFCDDDLRADLLAELNAVPT